MNENHMTNEREAKILDRFVSGIGRTSLDLLSVTVLENLIGALVGTEESKIKSRLAAAHVLMDALELEHGDTSKLEIQFLRVIERDNDRRTTTMTSDRSIGYDAAEPPEAVATIYCDECGDPIYEGESYYEIRGVVYCERCIKDMSVIA